MPGLAQQMGAREARRQTIVREQRETRESEMRVEGGCGSFLGESQNEDFYLNQEGNVVSGMEAETVGGDDDNRAKTGAQDGVQRDVVGDAANSQQANSKRVSDFFRQARDSQPAADKKLFKRVELIEIEMKNKMKRYESKMDSLSTQIVDMEGEWKGQRREVRHQRQATAKVLEAIESERVKEGKAREIEMDRMKTEMDKMKTERESMRGELDEVKRERDEGKSEREVWRERVHSNIQAHCTAVAEESRASLNEMNNNMVVQFNMMNSSMNEQFNKLLNIGAVSQAHHGQGDRDQEVRSSKVTRESSESGVRRKLGDGWEGQQGGEHEEEKRVREEGGGGSKVVLLKPSGSPANKQRRKGEAVGMQDETVVIDGEVFSPSREAQLDEMEGGGSDQQINLDQQMEEGAMEVRESGNVVVGMGGEVVSEIMGKEGGGTMEVEVEELLGGKEVDDNEIDESLWEDEDNDGPHFDKGYDEYIAGQDKYLATNMVSDDQGVLTYNSGSISSEDGDEGVDATQVDREVEAQDRENPNLLH